MSFKSAQLRARCTRVFHQAVTAIKELRTQLALAKHASTTGTASAQATVDLDEAIIALSSVVPSIEAASQRYQERIKDISVPNEREAAQDEYDTFMSTVEGDIPMDPEDISLLIGQLLAEANMRLTKLRSSPVQTVQVKPSSTPTVHLPIIELSKFDGAHEHWEEFWDLFLENVHSRSDIGDATKMHLLRQHLKGDALRTVKGLGKDGNKYAAAVQFSCCRPNMASREQPQWCS